MVAPFAGLKTDEAVFNYFSNVAGRLGPDVPLVYQDYPFSTGASISVPCFLRLVKSLPSLVMLKHEEWPGLGKLTAIRTRSEEEDVRRVSILCGNGGLYLPQELGRGADGAMPSFGIGTRCSPLAKM